MKSQAGKPAARARLVALGRELCGYDLIPVPQDEQAAEAIEEPAGVIDIGMETGRAIRRATQKRFHSYEFSA
jgi:hypothetical protein